VFTQKNFGGMPVCNAVRGCFAGPRTELSKQVNPADCRLRARPIVNNHRDTETFGELLTHDARDDVIWSAGREADNQPD
jgi:hypothetical protein